MICPNMLSHEVVHPKRQGVAVAWHSPLVVVARLLCSLNKGPVCSAMALRLLLADSLTVSAPLSLRACRIGVGRAALWEMHPLCSKFRRCLVSRLRFRATAVQPRLRLQRLACQPLPRHCGDVQRVALRSADASFASSVFDARTSEAGADQNRTDDTVSAMPPPFGQDPLSSRLSCLSFKHQKQVCSALQLVSLFLWLRVDP